MAFVAFYSLKKNRYYFYDKIVDKATTVTQLESIRFLGPCQITCLPDSLLYAVLYACCMLYSLPAGCSVNDFKLKIKL